MKVSRSSNLLTRKGFIIFIFVAAIAALIIGGYQAYSIYTNQQGRITSLSALEKKLTQQLNEMKIELDKLKSEDQYQRNEKLQAEIEQIQKTYTQSVKSYESLLDLKAKTNNTAALDKLLAQSISYLADKNYASAQATLTNLDKQIAAENTKVATTFSIPATTKASNTAPDSGYSRQRVSTEVGDFLVDIVSADLGSTRVIVDTASDSDCKDSCPVLSLGDYVSRNGAFAGINGSYFCPADYPSCAGKTNTYDTLAMNKNKTYFNSDNNVYSTVPVVVFGNGYARFIGRSLDWGRDTSPDGVLANQPLLLSGGNIAFGGDGDPKKGSRGSRSFVGSNGSKVYIGVVHNATVAEVAYALKTLGLNDALNLDSGGSTALWSGGYKAGPGRNIPNAILFVRR